MRVGCARRHLGDLGPRSNFHPRALFSSYREIGIKLSLGKPELAPGWERAVEKELAAGTFAWLPVTRAHCDLVQRLPFHHRDPFDRLLVAQALAEGAALVSSDLQLGNYGVELVW